MFERPTPPGDPDYWDRPDPEFPPHLDTFSLFAMNEQTLYEMHHAGFEQEDIDRVRGGMDRLYAAHRRELAEQYLAYPAHLRAHQWFTRDFLPQLQFWPSGDCLDGHRPR